MTSIKKACRRRTAPRVLNKSLVYDNIVSMFAIIKTGGKQYIVQPGDKIKVEKLETSEGKEVSFDALLVSDKETLLGTPYVKGYKVKAKVLGQGRGKKIIVYKYKAKKRYHKKQGHRQAYTELEVISIGKGTATATKSKVGGEVSGSAKPKTASAATRIKALPAAKKLGTKKEG